MDNTNRTAVNEYETFNTIIASRCYLFNWVILWSQQAHYRDLHIISPSRPQCLGSHWSTGAAMVHMVVNINYVISNITHGCLNRLRHFSTKIYISCYAFSRSPMMTSSNGNIFRITDPLRGEAPVTGGFSSQSPVTRSFDVFSDVRLNKGLSK